MDAARFVIRLAAWLAPSAVRADWRREWLAELDARPRRRRGPAPLVFALGAPVHALWLRVDRWRPGRIAADARFAVRMLRRRPLFAIASILTLALGIGATTAIFSVVYGVVIKPFPYREPDRLVQLWETNPLFNWTDANLAPGNFLSWQERNRVFEDIAIYFGSDTRQGGTRDVTIGGDEPIRTRALPVSSNFFDVLGVPARIGRTFAPGEDIPGQHRLIVLSDGLWRRRFGGDPAIVNRPVLLNGLNYTVIGVMPAWFRFDAQDTDMWLPLSHNAADWLTVRRPHYLHAVARLKPGVTVTDAQTNLSAIARDLEREFPDTNRQMGAGVGPLDDWFVGRARQGVLLFLAAVGLLLLIACANVANLFLARASERVRELSVRAALGADRLQLARQLLIEAAVVAGCGAALGVGLAAGVIRAFVATAPRDLPRVAEIQLNPVVLAFAVGLAGLTTLLFGLAPAVSAARANLTPGLADGARVTAMAGRRLRRGLVVVEVALAVILLAGATLALRSFRALVSVDPGFRMSGLLSARVSLPGLRYDTADKQIAFYETAVARLRELPGVNGAGAANKLPLGGYAWTGQLHFEGRAEVVGRELRHKTVTPGYLETLGLRLIAGRGFLDSDRAGGETVVIANDAFVRTYCPDGNAVGRRIAFSAPGPSTQWSVIIGVVAGEPQDRVDRPSQPEVYSTYRQSPQSDLALVVRTAGDPAGRIADLRRVVRAIDPQLALFDVETMAERFGTSLARERLAAWLAGIFAIVALLLASVGIYGVAAASVASRTREIGVRVAFGATARDVFRLILGEEMRVIGVGLAMGLALTLAVGELVAALLYGVRPTDVVSLATSVAALLIPACAACIVPARRALRVNPVDALRSD